MRKIKPLFILLAIVGTFLFASCSIIKRNQDCWNPKKKGYKYTPRLQGNQKWNYKKHMGPKRKVK